MRKRSAFTLIELLVVIGIIIALIGILLPVFASVRKSANAAATQQRLATIGGAIQRYYSDFNAYPGPFGFAPASVGGASVSQIENGAPKFVNSAGAVITVTGTAKVTSSENLVLGLLGGLSPVTTAGAISALSYDPTKVGMGPSNLNPNSPKRYSPYMDATGNVLSKGSTGLTGYADSVIPEFMDTFNDQLPILYLRARVGATGVATNNDTMQYNYNHVVTSYNFPNPPNATDFPSGWSQYLGNPAMANEARGKDAFILISAGKDGKYGTKDDLFN